MTLDINGEGRIVLRDVSDEAAAYLLAERHKVLRDNDPAYWYFGKSYGGTVYLHISPGACKSDIVAIMNVLEERYGMRMETPAAQHLWQAWKGEAAREGANARAYERESALKDELSALKRLLRRGCKGCENFCHDGDYGRCKLTGRALTETPLGLQYGEYDGRGVLHVGQKFYPVEGCKYL